MAGKKSISNVQETLAQYLGKNVTLKANSGRKKYIERSGVLEGTYPNLFVVRVKEKSVERRMSFSYVDLITGTVVLTVKDGEENIPLLVNQQ